MFGSVTNLIDISANKINNTPMQCIENQTRKEKKQFQDAGSQQVS